MRSVALLLLLATAVPSAEPQRSVLVQELVRLEAMEKKTIGVFPLEQQDAQLEARFSSKLGGEGVRIAVFARGTAAPVAESGYELNDTLRVPLKRDHEYRIELENLRQRLGHALVDVEVTLVFGARPAPAKPEAARTLDPQRRLYTIVASLTLFFLILAYSAVRLAPPVLARWKGDR